MKSDQVGCGVACVLAVVFMSGCTTLPYKVEQQYFRNDLSSRQYARAKVRMDESLSLVPPQKRDKLERYFMDSLLRQSWQEYSHRHWDQSFDLMTTAKMKTSADLRGAWPQRCSRIAQSYATFHLDRGNAALHRKDLKNAIAAYRAASKAQNATGGEARMAANRYTEKRENLKEVLEAAKRQIEDENWAEAASTIAGVRPQDTSLSAQCTALSSLLIKSHSQAALRDSRSLLASGDFTAAYSKVKEAQALGVSRADADQLKGQIQSRFIAFADDELKAALEHDVRSKLRTLASQYAAFDISKTSSRIRTVLENRDEADRHLHQAKASIAAGHHAVAIPSLRQARELWPENQMLRNLFDETCAHAARATLSKADGVDKSQYPLSCALLSVLARSICPADPEIKKAAEDVMSDSISSVDCDALKIAFVAEVSAKPDAARVLDAAGLANAIVDTLSPSSRFVSVLKAGAGAPDAASVLRVVADIRSMSITTQEKTNEKTLHYVSHVEHDPNPVHVQLQADLNAARIRMNEADIKFQKAQAVSRASRQASRVGYRGLGAGLFNAVNTVAAVGGATGMVAAKNAAAVARNEFNAIARRMNSTPGTTPRDVYADHTYTEHHYERQGAFEAVVRVLDRTGRCLVEKPISDSYQDSDTAHDAFAPGQLEADPLSLPSEDALRARLRGKLHSGVKKETKAFARSYLYKKFSDAMSATDLTKREKLLALAIQFPVSSKAIHKELSKEIPNIPVGFAREIDARLASRDKKY